MENKEYIGKVIYIDDVTYSGRCKVKVFGLFDELPDEMIPWFTPMTGTVFSTNGAGNLSVPKINSIVRVRFSNNDMYSGEYMTLQNVDPTLCEEIKNDYNGTHVLLYDADEELAVIYQKMSGIKISLKDSVIRIGADGIIQLKHQNNTNVIEMTDNQINIVAASDNATINVAASGTVDLSAQNVKLSSDNIAIGNNPDYHCVVGEKLQTALKDIVNELIAKTPQGSALAGRTFSEILSNTAKIQK